MYIIKPNGNKNLESKVTMVMKVPPFMLTTVDAQVSLALWNW
jgi:hypothetical protein